MIASYRDPRYAASIRIEQARREADRDTQEILPELAAVHASRVARTWAGAVGVAGAFAVAFMTAAQSFIGGWFTPNRPTSPRPTHLLLASVAASILVYFVVRPLAALTFRARVKASLPPDRDELAALAHLEERSLRRAAARLAGRGEARSLALPMVAAVLLAPLSLHLVVWLLILLVRGDSVVRELVLVRGFDAWIGMSLFLVGVAHLVIASFCVLFAQRAAAARSCVELACKSPVSGWQAYGWTVAASCFPGALALCIPPVLVAVTGVLLIPALFGFMHNQAIHERRILEDAA